MQHWGEDQSWSSPAASALGRTLFPPFRLSLSSLPEEDHHAQHRLHQDQDQDHLLFPLLDMEEGGAISCREREKAAVCPPLKSIEGI